MKMITRGIYPHPSFTELHDHLGSGYYRFSERVGLGGVFYLNSAGAIPYSPRDTGPDIRVYDIYDVLRAVEEGRAERLDTESGWLR